MNTVINLKGYRPFGSKSYIGRVAGKSARLSTELDRYDDITDQCILLIPEDTVSFNPSFFLGMFAKSVERLGEEGFNRKYTFQFETQDDNARESLEKNITDGMRNTLNALADTRSRALFLNDIE